MALQHDSGNAFKIPQTLLTKQSAGPHLLSIVLPYPGRGSGLASTDNFQLPELNCFCHGTVRTATCGHVRWDKRDPEGPNDLSKSVNPVRKRNSKTSLSLPVWHFPLQNSSCWLDEGIWEMSSSTKILAAMRLRISSSLSGFIPLNDPLRLAEQRDNQHPHFRD